MCRMIAIVSDKPIKKEVINYCLIDARKSILKQSSFNNNRLQKDGWGVAYYSNSKPVVYKSDKPVFDEKEKLVKKIASVNSNIFLAHIRNASNPKKLPHNRLISVENSQPYSYGNIVFSHNGTLSIVDDIYLNLGKYKKYIKGVNDSEVLFWNFIKHLNAYGNIKTAIEMMRDEINTIWISVKKNYPDLKKPYNGLNLFVSDGNQIYALCDFVMEKESYSLMSKGWEYGRFAIKRFDDYTVISSEPVDDTDGWEKVKPLTIISIKKTNINISDIGE
ncbi:MAG: class II glutamine amidotransferase [Elusimicrobia bacterium]|nr:class II glutamine amidotransferase [Elusimicrobiota bacterium]